MLIDFMLRALIAIFFVFGVGTVSYFITRTITFFVTQPVLSIVILSVGTFCLSIIILLGLSYYYVYHGWRGQEDIYRRNSSLGKKVAITFDDGPSRDYTPLLLDVLAEKKAPATFFLVGAHVEKYPELAQRIADEGHELGNHTFRHINVFYASPARLASEIMKTNLVILKATGKYPLYIRPPRGLYDTRFRQLAKLMGHYLVLWSLSAQDWYPRVKASFIAARIVSQVSAGEIILFHDSGSLLSGEGASRRATVEALPRIIDGLRQRGYKIVPLADFFSINLDQKGEGLQKTYGEGADSSHRY